MDRTVAAWGVAGLGLWACSTGPISVDAGLDGGRLPDGGSGNDAGFYCALHFPGALATTPSVSPAQPVLGWVFLPGVTDQGSQAGPGITAQVGFGPLGSAPDATWSWASAVWDRKIGASAMDDEYAGTLPAPPLSGRFDFAVRFSLDHGVSWTPCDTVGNTPTSPYQPAAAGVLDVAPPVITFCAIHSPAALSTTVGAGAGPVSGWVSAPGLTDRGPEAGLGIAGQLGEGTVGSVPGSAWVWTDATWTGKVGPSGHDDAYVASLPAQTDAGTFAYAFRFEIDGGAGWTNCDLSGDATYLAADAGLLTVLLADGGADGGPDSGLGGLVRSCRFGYPAALLGEAGATSTPLVGVVHQPGVTSGVGQGAGILAQVGIGPSGSVPDSALAGGSDAGTDGGWIWTAASYAGDVDGPAVGDLADDRYRGAAVFGPAGSYAMAYRFSADDGGSWRTCDLAGDAVYAVSSQASLTVVAGPLTVDFCDLQAPATATASPGQSAGLAYGQVYKAGVTDQDLLDAGAGLLAELGVGPLLADPTLADSGFVWSAAAFEAKRGPGSHNDEYQAELVAPAPIGTYAYYFRFSEDDGAVWTVCGYLNPIALGGDAGVLTVP